MAPPSIFRSLGIAYLLASYVPLSTAMARPSLDGFEVLVRRATSCPSARPNSCQAVNTKLPNNFCCPSDSACISLDSGSSAVCCPEGTTCKTIQPISCDVSRQNASSDPLSAIFTTKLSSNLQVCGSQCCPFGYTCNAALGHCDLVISTSSLASSSDATHTTSGSASQPTTSPAAGSTSGIDSASPHPPANCTKFPGAAVAAGFFPGMLAGALLMLLAIIFFGSGRPSSRPSSNSSSFYKPRAMARNGKGGGYDISDPIPLAEQHSRTDFIRRTTTRARSLFGSRPNSNGFVPGGSNWKMPTPPEQNNIPVMPGGRTIPVTPERQMTLDSEVSRTSPTESIRVYSPPPAVPLNSITARAQHETPSRPAIGSPFKTPPAKEQHHFGGDPSPSNYGGETLTPARYNDGSRNDEPVKPKERRETTFTEILRDAGIPDPGRVPAVPAIPNNLDKGKGKGKTWR